MKISKKLVFNIIALILLTNLISLFIISNNTPKIFWNYLYKEKNKEIINIKESIIKNIKSNNTFDATYLEHLQRHADVQNLFIEVRDGDNIIYSSGKEHLQNYNLSKLDNIRSNDDVVKNDNGYNQYVEKDFKLFRDRNVLLEIGYYEKNNTLEDTIQMFSFKIIILTLFSTMFSIFVGIIVSMVISRQLSKPIVKLNENTKSILQGNYNDVEILSTKITEIDELSNSITELSSNIKNQENIRKEMVQNLSHDIRTPLTILKSHFEAILDGVLELDDRNVNILNLEIDRLMSLIKKLDDLTAVSYAYSNDNHNNKLMYLNISTETDNIIDSFYIGANKKNINIKKNIEPDLMLKIDKLDYYQLLQNLISNAVKYNKVGGEVHIKLFQSSSNIILEVSDTGIGIEGNKIKYIFERFYRSDNSRSKEIQGNGIGLAIVKELVSNMSATIDVESKTNLGTKFTIHFKK